MERSKGLEIETMPMFFAVKIPFLRNITGFARGHRDNDHKIQE
jgi:hypothetical protein